MSTIGQLYQLSKIEEDCLNLGPAYKDIGPLHQKVRKTPLANPLTQAILFLQQHLTQTHNPLKGRTLSTNGPIRAGELLMADLPYAVLPTVATGSVDDFLCSNLGCSRQVSRHAINSVTCKKNCSLDVWWCNESCKDEDQARHDLECAWLKAYSSILRQDVGDHDYYLLWIVVRLLATRHLEIQGTTPTNIHQHFTFQDRFTSGWQETNVFELCPGPTEILPDSTPAPHRGTQYGLAVFLRITLANHSCAPNVTHQADDRGRLMVTALRDIAPGEECCTSYFDLSEYVDLQARRNKTQELFTFTCQHPLFIPFQHVQQIRHYSPSHDHQITATRSTIAQLLNHIDSPHTATQYLTHFASTNHSQTHPFAVIKVGGAILTSHLQTLTSTLALFSRIGIYPVIVHGGGPQLNQILENAGVEPQFEDGIRVTDGRTLAIARQLFLEENLKLVQALERVGVAARPITAGVFRADYLDQKRYGFVGKVRGVEKNSILSAVRAKCLPVLTSMAETPSGQVLNVNADVAAVELARALKPKKVVYLAEKGGLTHGLTGRRIQRINLAEEFEELMGQSWVKFGTRLKIRAVEELLRELPGLESVAIVHPVDLQREIFVASGAGTRIERGTRILSTTSAEFRDEGRLVKGLREQGAGDDEVRFCVQEMRNNRPLKMYFQDPETMSPLAIVSFEYGGTPRLVTFPDRSVDDAVAGDLFTRITKDFPKLVWNLPENDGRLDWFSARATGRFHHGGWAMLWYGLSQHEARQLILGFQDNYQDDLQGTSSASAYGYTSRG
ncbi:uncharacterized protein BO80DRAFT_456052 [Aspergillus ibericus CBS 121593]|uniref:acetylglutamate kinase n=1 Tax=Aspergillus ibericus CBS 121593 TaxID=1448316 RepID=A0A395GXX0_9EURO|nr:hypothetical protein BO80DRAFT_456052 [Aspergillus ibericus CBS 121593]RAK99908.1 hypothetical protein BO80DRAFT_456052 [Aspergillus ibericus CBS 121593]